jgi:SNF2 family DNA or RNA helicase
MRTFNIRPDVLDHIMEHKKYYPFRNQNELYERINPATVTIERSDVFDVSYDKHVYEPIPRPVKIEGRAFKVAAELIKAGFTDRFVLGRAAALELMLRLQDVCNGFEPVKKEETDVTTFVPFKDNPKLDALMELLDEIGTEENQVVVWCSRTNAMDSILERLSKEGISAVRYSGAENDTQKRAAEGDFVSGKAQVFVANQQAAGYGLNCLRDCNYMVWYSINDSTEQYAQAQHRILRGASKTPKFAYALYVEGSVEQRSMLRLALGQTLLSAKNTKEMFDFA